MSEKITRVSVQNFRCHTKKTISLSPKTTIIVGKNGVGKTSFLEAIHFALTGSSFKGRDSDILRRGAEWWRVDVDLKESGERTVRYTTKKEFSLGEKKVARLSFKDKYPVVVFEPDDTLLLQGSPDRRRRFLDALIAKIEPSFPTTLRKYEKALAQRNALLKKGIQSPESYFPWNIMLSEYGSAIVARRARIIELLNAGLREKYETIAQSEDEVIIRNPHPPEENSASILLEKLDDNFDRDLLLKHTTSGPHRHDVEFLLNGAQARETASRGETRTLILGLKQLEVDIIKDVTGKSPIVLLDDVFSELDPERQTQLVYGAEQYIITTTHAPETSAKVIQL